MGIEEPILGQYASAFHFHATLAGVLGPALVRDQVGEVYQPSQERLVAPVWMMEAFHRKQLPLNGVMGLIQEGARGGHLRVLEDRIPVHLLGLQPALHPCTIGGSSGMGDMVRKAPHPLAKPRDKFNSRGLRPSPW
jgi:hypothetical protein